MTIFGMTYLSFSGKSKYPPGNEGKHIPAGAKKENHGLKGAWLYGGHMLVPSSGFKRCQKGSRKKWELPAFFA